MSSNIYLANVASINVLKRKNYIKLAIKSDNLTNLKNFVISAIENDSLNKLSIYGTQKANLDILIKSKKHIKAKIKTKIKRAYFNEIGIKNLIADVPLLINYQGKKNGFANLEVYYKNFRIHIKAKIKSENNTILANLKFSSNDNLTISPFLIKINTAHFNFSTSSINIRMKTKILKILADLKLYKKKNLIKIPGKIILKAFDGTIKISKIKINLNNLPIISCNIDFYHINLKKLTDITNFGTVTGFVKGYIHNLKLVDFKNPLSFNMLVKTQNVRGVSKRISLQAVNSISKVGGGLASIAIPFFKNFSYSSIGFRAILKNNTFTIHGLYKDKNREYIVRKGILFGVSVINMNPKSEIEWNDFLNRLKRVIKKKGGKK